MKTRLTLATAVLLACATPALGQQSPRALADPGPDHHLLYRPGEIDWQAGPPSLAPGAEFAVLEGDPGAAGVFTMRLRLPDGFVIAPHTHPNVERVTVVSGHFLLGSGSEADRAATEEMAPGSYTSLPPRTAHYAIAEGETVIQLTSVGPWVIEYVNREDDPRP